MLPFSRITGPSSTLDRDARKVSAVDILPDRWYHLPMRRSLLLPLLITIVGMVSPQDLYRPCDHGPESMPAIRYAQTAALVDAENGALLYEIRGDRPWPPASLTKLVAIYTAFEAASEGRFSFEKSGPVDPQAWASSVPEGSSLMYLGPDHDVSGRQLLSGLLVSSGNDAAVELAIRVSGSVPRFVEEMNGLVDALGYSEFVFYDPAGLDGGNRITAAGFARFSAMLVRVYPEVLRYTAQADFTYPSPPARGVTQPNRNGLVGRYVGADGLKTGFIEESGYNIAVSAHRDGLRLIAVVLGVEASSHEEGARLRESDARALLDWGFETWASTVVGVPEINPVAVYGGRSRVGEVHADTPERLLILRADQLRLRGELSVEEHLWAPLPAGSRVGSVRYLVDECVIGEYPIFTTADIERGPVVRRIWDRIRWWFLSLGRRISGFRANS